MRPSERSRKRCRPFDIKIAFNKWTIWRGFYRDTLGIGSEAIAAVDSTCRRGWIPQARDRGSPNVPHLGAMTLEGRART